MLDESSSTTGFVCDVLEKEFIVLFLLQHSPAKTSTGPPALLSVVGLERLLSDSSQTSQGRPWSMFLTVQQTACAVAVQHCKVRYGKVRQGTPTPTPTLFIPMHGPNHHHRRGRCNLPCLPRNAGAVPYSVVSGEAPTYTLLYVVDFAMDCLPCPALSCPVACSVEYLDYLSRCRW